MALARLYMKNFNQRVFSLPHYMKTITASWESQLGSFSTTTEKASEGGEMEVSKGKSEKSKLSPRKRRGLWRSGREISPFRLNDFLRPSGHGLGNALVQMTENLGKIVENLAPSRLFGRMKEDEKSYKLKFEVPGLRREDIKITIEDGCLVIKGEHKEEEEDSSDDDQWFARSYGYYFTTVILPEDAKVEEIKAELKDGILNVTIPRSETPKKYVKEVEIK